SEFKVPLWTVASFNHNIESEKHIVVGDAPQETDIAVANAAHSGDIVVTQDWGLASIVLGKGASAISPVGRIYKPETIAFLLEERELKARLRRGGVRTKGPAKRTPEDDQRFEANLRKLLSLK
ncbi:MAG: DUF188 domain-containing protein, partial [Thermodesulfobacteriota bacterium]